MVPSFLPPWTVLVESLTLEQHIESESVCLVFPGPELVQTRKLLRGFSDESRVPVKG